jgi:hypothetical protein
MNCHSVDCRNESHNPPWQPAKPDAAGHGRADGIHLLVGDGPHRPVRHDEAERGEFLRIVECVQGVGDFHDEGFGGEDFAEDFRDLRAADAHPIRPRR